MKKTRYLIVIALWTLYGCNTVKEARLKPMHNIAVVSIFCNKWVDVSDLKGGMLSSLSALAQNEEFRIDTVAGVMRALLFDAYADKLSLRLAPEESVLNAKGYENIKPGFTGHLRPITAPGYNRIHYKRKKKLRQVRDILPDNIDGILVVAMEHKLKQYQIMGVGKTFIRADIHFYLYNHALETVIRYDGNARSDNSIATVGGIFKAEELKQLSIEATRNVYDQLVKFYHRKTG